MLISGHAQAGDIAAATAVLESMALRGLVPTRESYNTIISCLCHAGEAQQAQHVVGMAARRGIQLDEWAWSAVIQVRLSVRDAEVTAAVALGVSYDVHPFSRHCQAGVPGMTCHVLD